MNFSRTWKIFIVIFIVGYFFVSIWFVVMSSNQLTLINYLQSQLSSKEEQVTSLQSDVNSLTFKNDQAIESLKKDISSKNIVLEENSLTRKIRVFVFNENKPGASDNCVANDYVYRIIPGSITPLKDSLNTLFSSTPTDAEKATGIRNLFADPGEADYDNAKTPVTLKSATIENGVAIITLENTALTVGGSCRVGIMRSQLEQTAKQFATVDDVKILPDTAFQP